MSRTIRRKNYDKQGRSTGGSKIAGAYTEYDWASPELYCSCSHCAGGNLRVYREPTAEERLIRFLNIFTDKGHDDYRFANMKKHERRIEERMHRSKANRSIHAFLRGRTEDVLLEKLPKFSKTWWP